MLVAWDSEIDVDCAAPDHEGSAQLALLRARTKAGVLLCRVCKQKLILRAGQERCVHFAHRVLADCPSAHDSIELINTRRLLYLFFRSRIDSGKLAGSVSLEPVIPDLPHKLRVDVLLTREAMQSLGVVIVEKRVPSDARREIRRSFGKTDFETRTVFLKSALAAHPEREGVFLLTPTQQELSHPSDFGQPEAVYTRKSLHFVDHATRTWMTLRGLHLVHAPRAFAAESVETSVVDEVKWAPHSAEWVHPGEKKLVAALGGPSPGLKPPNDKYLSADDVRSLPRKHNEPVQPSWLNQKLPCKCCHNPTSELNWVTADLKAGVCVCKECFARGAR